MARTVVFDFDGVIHSYVSGWRGETIIPDPPVIGIREALADIHDAGYEVVVVSTRCKTEDGKMAIEEWLDLHGMTQYVDKVCKEKPPAIAYIDDRAICFDGHPETLLRKIQDFQPWYKKTTAERKSKWIRIEDRLPEEYQDVLMFFDAGNMAVGWHNSEDVHFKVWYAYSDDGFAEPCDSIPIYWMPLPPPPEDYPSEGESVCRSE